MDITKDYEKLYNHWHKEFQDTNLTELNDKTFMSYTKILKDINNHRESDSNPLKLQMFTSYKENFNFLFEDLLKIRKLKIINLALALKDIVFENVTEAEKKLYQNIVGSIKGYDKIKAISIYEGEEYQEPVSETRVEEIKPEISKSPDPVIEEKKPIVPRVKTVQEEDTIEYTLLVFLKKTPPLVGIDLLNYGPFEKEEIANIPSQNAKILILEKFAKKFDVS
ncbi:MAG: DNA replication complex subunit Gins51 [Promethearchaeota archaeon]|jgi:DNA replication initiation complex subunit (GINS family)